MTTVRSIACLACLLLPGIAHADCSDAAAPGVEWRRCLMDGEDLNGVNLSKADLKSTSFKRADLTNADLSEARVVGAKFVSAKMSGIRLDGANLQRADFTNAVLDGASLTDADLRQARFYETNLRRANLTGAQLDGADMLRTDFSGATWVDGHTVCADGSIGRCNRMASTAARGDDGL